MNWLLRYSSFGIVCTLLPFFGVKHNNIIPNQKAYNVLFHCCLIMQTLALALIAPNRLLTDQSTKPPKRSIKSLSLRLSIPLSLIPPSRSKTTLLKHRPPSGQDLCLISLLFALSLSLSLSSLHTFSLSFHRSLAHSLIRPSLIPLSLSSLHLGPKPLL